MLLSATSVENSLCVHVYVCVCVCVRVLKQHFNFKVGQ